MLQTYSLHCDAFQPSSLHPIQRFSSFVMLANSFRQLSRAAAGRALVNQSTTSFANLAPFATAAQPSDPKTVLAILYKAGDASQEKRLLGTKDEA